MMIDHFVSPTPSDFPGIKIYERQRSADHDPARRISHSLLPLGPEDPLCEKRRATCSCGDWVALVPELMIAEMSLELLDHELEFAHFLHAIERGARPPMPPLRHFDRAS